MPTTIPRATPSLTRGQAVRFFVLLGRARWLHYRMEVAHRRLERDKTDAAGDELLRIAHKWLAAHEAIITLLRVLPPPQVAQVQALVRSGGPDSST